MTLKQKILVFLVPVIFLIAGILTLNDYGINWDEPIHFQRGQGYLYYFLTGQIEQKGRSISQKPSFFNGYDVKALYDWDGGHPVTSDLLAAISNFIFYQKLGLAGDIQAYHLYNLFISTLVILIVAIFAYLTHGIFASIIASLVITTYPLFFAESHFNIKDPPETAFFALTIFAFWKSLEKGNWKWLIIASIGAGLALGTKLNIIFLPFIVIPYLFLRYFQLIKRGPKIILNSIKKIPLRYKRMLVISPFIVIAIPFITWPFLWQDTWDHISKVLNYYQDIALGFNYQPAEYRIGGFNLYPIFWIIVTTPPWVLLLSGVGLIYAISKPGREKTNWLWLLWLGIPIFRVSLPNTVIYGGVRQIMEFLPAMALLAGLGAEFIRKLLNKKLNFWISVIILLAFIPQLVVLTKIHPNENVYFNFLVGGLKGAYQAGIPSAGNSYGNAYWQAIQWINKNAPPNARLALVQGTGQNVPLIQLRPDIDFSGTNWTGINRGGEYLMELTYQGAARQYPSVWDYLERFLDPVYEVKIDNIALAKVWKNDFEHTKPHMRRNEVLDKDIRSNWKNNILTIDAKKNVEATRIVLNRQDITRCLKNGYVETSLDGQSWYREVEPLGTEQVIYQYDLGKNSVNFYLSGKELRFIKVITSENNSCFSNNSQIEIYILQ
ncbi:phospholipid carrier-dependent glycosyltransferase [Candidatus Microgenomates bacterium]|nr:phospholipid carrier-dependent glycosyltransferase [Candidatus Microgenomates bacterium]